MPYEELTDDEAIEFHIAVINKHQQLIADVYAKKNAITDGEKAERSKIVIRSMGVNVSADDFKKPIETEPTPSEKETKAILEGARENGST